MPLSAYRPAGLGDHHDHLLAWRSHRRKQEREALHGDVREDGVFYEHLATTIRDDFVAALGPRSLTVLVSFNSRGRIAISASSSYQADAKANGPHLPN